MNTFLMWVGGLLVAVFTALFAVPHFIDWNGYRGVVEEEATRLLGRDVRVGGKVDVRLLPAPYLRFEKLRIADTSGISGAPLFHVEGFTMWLAISPLLRGDFVAERIELDRPTVTVSVDKDGLVNWRSLAVADGALPFVPAHVALQAVGIKDGVLSLHIDAGGEIARVTDLDGEFVASSLRGPYTYRGTASWQGMTRDVRLQTTEADRDGRMRLSSQVRGRGGRDTYKLEGQVRSLFERPAFDGTLEARLGLETIGKDAMSEIRAVVTAAPASLDLSSIAITFENIGQPQIVAGGFKADWGRRHAVSLDLSARWLDLDRLAGALSAAPAPAPATTAGGGGPGGAAAPLPSQTAAPAAPAATPAAPVAASSPAQPAPSRPLDTARRLFASLAEGLPQDTDIAARFSADQVTLGGEAVSGVALRLERKGGPLEVERLRAGLPGGARLEFTGEVQRTGEDTVYDGDMFMGGPSSARLLRWLAGPEAVAGDIADGPFNVSGRLRFGRDRLVLADALMEVAGESLRGAVDWRTAGERRGLDVALEGEALDTRALGIASADIPHLSRLFGAAPAGSAPDWLDGGTETRLILRLGRLLDRGHALRDVDLAVTAGHGRLSIERAKATLDGGLVVEADGSLSGMEAGRAKGSLRYLVAGDSAEAATALASGLVGAEGAGGLAPRLASLVPFRLAGRLVTDPATGLVIDAAGRIGGGPANATVRLEGGLSGWRTAPVEVVVRVDGGPAGRLYSGWLGLPHGAGNRGGGEQATGLIKIAGVPDRSLKTLAMIESENRTLLFNGESGLVGETLAVHRGEIAVSGTTLAELMGYGGIDTGGRFAELTIAGLVDLERSEAGYRLRPRDVNVGGATVSGTIDARLAEDGRPRLEAVLTADAGRLDRLLAAVQARPQGAAVTPAATAAMRPAGSALQRAAGAEPATAEPEPFLSDEAFDLTLGERGSFGLDVTFARLAIGNGLVLDDARIVATVDGKGLDARLERTPTLGGAAEARLVLAKAPAGIDAEARLMLAEVDLARLAAVGDTDGGGRSASGRATLDVAAKGRALSPQGVIAVLSGSGTVTLDDAAVQGFTAAAINEATERILTGTDALSADTVATAIAAASAEGRLVVGDRQVKVEVIDGALRFAPVEVVTPAGRTTQTTTIDIASLAVDGAFEIVPVTKPAGAGAAAPRPWPSILVTYAGPLAKLATLSPTLRADGLERELTVRKMERNVDELERLRRLDEEAAARERERQKALEEARRRALEQQQVAPGGAAPSGDPTAPPSGSAAPGAVAPGGGPATGPATGDGSAQAAGLPAGVEATPSAGAPGWSTEATPGDQQRSRPRPPRQRPVISPPPSIFGN
ncbi:MAG: AsmA family protein [Hyphomicrobiaceae bacterium]|nr:AsmA family protein [Hyphomicrobiaceae bacterium]